MHFLEGLGALIGFGSILFLAYVTTRYVAGKTNKSMKGRYISIIETVSLGFDRQIYLVKAGGQYILLASSGKNLEFLTSIKPEDIEPFRDEEQEKVFDFKSLFEKYVPNIIKGDKRDTNAIEGKDIEEFGSSEGDVFKSNLQKLKTITTRTDGQRYDNGDDNTNDKT